MGEDKNQKQFVQLINPLTTRHVTAAVHNFFSTVETLQRILEPHRLIQFINTLIAKVSTPPLWVVEET